MCLANSRVVGVGIRGRFVAFVLAFLFLGLTQIQAQQGVPSDSERGNAAIGHYARARALIIEALAEFELGKRLADPDMLLDSQQWRMTLVSRAEELNRVLDPKPRITRSGAYYKANSRLIREDRNLTTDDIKNYPKSDNAEKEIAPQKPKTPQPKKVEAVKPEKMVKEETVKLPAITPVKKEPTPPVEEAENPEEEVVLGSPTTKEQVVTDSSAKAAVEKEKVESDLPPAKETTEVSSKVVKQEVQKDSSVFPLEQPEVKASEAAGELDVDKAIEAVIQEKLQNLETKGK